MAQANVAGGQPAPGGSSPDRPDAPTRRMPGPSLRPALVVVGLALVIVLVFGIGAAFTHDAAPKAPASTAVQGTGLVAEPAAATLRPVEILGTPPADVLDALVLPKGARAVSHTPWSGSTQYSAEMSFRLDASQATLVRFFRTELRDRGWSISGVGAAHDDPRATEVLGQRASDDGWFWEAGFVVSPTTFGHAGAETTVFVLDLFEVPDAT